MNHFDTPTFPADGRRLQPGEEGWWPVWGAGVKNVRSGDRIITLEDGELVETDVYVVTDRTVGACVETPAGDKFTFGYLSPIKLFRWGARNTLA